MLKGNYHQAEKEIIKLQCWHRNFFASLICLEPSSELKGFIFLHSSKKKDWWLGQYKNLFHLIIGNNIGNRQYNIIGNIIRRTSFNRCSRYFMLIHTENIIYALFHS